MEKPQDPLSDRRKALEEDYFRKQSEKLKEKLRSQQERETRRQELQESFPGLRPEGLELLLEHGLDAEAVAALGLVPCVLVAWAEGPPDAREREAVLRAAESQGVGPGTKAQRLLEGWLAERPSSSLVDTWAHYVQAILAAVPETERQRIRDGVRRMARGVAEATGGFLGLGSKVSSAEEAVLARIEKGLS